MAGAIALGRLTASLLVGVTSWDPVSLFSAVSTLLLVAVLAAALPGSRAARVDPNQALRSD